MKLKKWRKWNVVKLKTSFLFVKTGRYLDLVVEIAQLLAQFGIARFTFVV